MTINYEKINFQKIAPIIALSFAIGFGVATGAYFLVFCPDCLTPISFGSTTLTIEKKCADLLLKNNSFTL